jgi:hypothetical protein
LDPELKFTRDRLLGIIEKTGLSIRNSDKMKKYEDNKNKIKHNKSKQDEFDEDLNFIV